MKINELYCLEMLNYQEMIHSRKTYCVRIKITESYRTIDLYHEILSR